MGNCRGNRAHGDVFWPTEHGILQRKQYFFIMIAVLQCHMRGEFLNNRTKVVEQSMNFTASLDRRFDEKVPKESCR